MSPESALVAIRHHAEGSSDASGQGLADVLWRRGQGAGSLDLDQVWLELVQSFQALRSEFLSWQAKGVPLPLSYAVAEILGHATKLGLTASDNDSRSQGVLLSWRVSVAWDALMAGDIDHIAEHVRSEEQALGLNPSEGDRSHG